ncbi:MAG: N-acetylmuramoyl-L-alanine amidase [bacterium]
MAFGVYYLTIGRDGGKPVTVNRPAPVVSSTSPAPVAHTPVVAPAATATTATTAAPVTQPPAPAVPIIPLPAVKTVGNLVCIDPGHPSEVSDADSMQHGVTEVEMNWQVALRLKALLEAQGVKVVMTKSSLGEKVTNKRRAEIANEAGAAMLIRLHCDSGKNNGYAIYAPDRQGKAQGVTGPSQAVIDASQQAAQRLHDGMSALLAGQLKDNGVKGDSATLIGGRQGALTGSIFSTVPAVTVEMCFLSNADDARFINSNAGQELMANALARGVVEYLNNR